MEKRRFSRIPLSIEAFVSCRSISFKAPVNNLSLKGMLVDCPVSLIEGDLARITLYLTGTSRRLDFSISFFGKVIRSGNGSAAVSIHEIDLDSFTQLRNIIAYNSGDADRVRHEFIESIRSDLSEIRKAV